MQESCHKYDFRVRWEPFLLRSNIPPEGVPKPAPAAGSPRVSPHLKAAGQAVGIDFTGKCDRYPNTLQSHALLEYAKTVGDGAVQNDLQEAIFQAYFTDGLYPDEANLLAVAQRVGLDVQQCTQVIRNQDKITEAREKALNWSMKGVNGVPYFIMNDQPTFSGAQEPDTFVKIFDKIIAKFPPAAVSAEEK